MYPPALLSRIENMDLRTRLLELKYEIESHTNKYFVLEHALSFLRDTLMPLQILPWKLNWTTI